MRLLLTAALAAALLAAAPIQAAEKKGEPSAEHYLDISTVALPVIWQGRAVNYVFTDVRIHLVPRIDAIRLRDKEPFLRDALVRLGHRTPFVRPWDFTHVDAAALVRGLRPEAERIVGPAAITSIEVTRQTPRQTAGLPQRPKPPGRPGETPTAPVGD